MSVVATGEHRTYQEVIVYSNQGGTQEQKRIDTKTVKEYRIYIPYCSKRYYSAI
jgi:hypothetical protein